MNFRLPPGITPAHLVSLVLLLAAGCSSAPPSPPYDSKQAEETLVLALDAWKQGRAADLAKRAPPVRFEDEDFRDGLRLTDYRVDERDRPLRPFADVRVAISLLDRQGRPLEKTVAYQVAVSPGLAVLRND